MFKHKESTAQIPMLAMILVTCGLYVGWRIHTRRAAFHYRKLDVEMNALREAMSERQSA
jgi:hypothetical protein